MSGWSSEQVTDECQMVIDFYCVCLKLEVHISLKISLYLLATPLVNPTLYLSVCKVKYSFAV